MPNLTAWTKASKATTGWTKATKTSTDWSNGSSFESPTWTLGSTNITLANTTVNLLGYAAGTHFFDTKPSTDWSGN